MSYPTKIFGHSARPKHKINENIRVTSRIGDITIQVLRWEISDFEISGFSLTSGHFLSFRVTDAKGSQDLLQGKSVFFAGESLPRLEGAAINVPQGDGVVAPKWHKCDRAWPELDGVKARFVGQFYFESTVAYLFSVKNGALDVYAVFKDEIDRQDAEEHYAEEEDCDQTKR